MMLFYCDPKLNTSCSKKQCFTKGGPCVSTMHIAFAKQPIMHVRLVVDKETFQDILDGETKSMSIDVENKGDGNE